MKTILISAFKKTSNIILLCGVLLVCLRLFLPVLQCNYAHCESGQVLYFQIHQPRQDYSIHAFRTFTEAAGIALLFGTIFWIIKREELSTMQ